MFEELRVLKKEEESHYQYYQKVHADLVDKQKEGRELLGIKSYNFDFMCSKETRDFFNMFKYVAIPFLFVLFSIGFFPSFTVISLLFLGIGFLFQYRRLGS